MSAENYVELFDDTDFFPPGQLIQQTLGNTGTALAVQGKMGDCWLIACLNSLLLRAPDMLKKLVQQRPDGKVEALLYVDGMKTSVLMQPTRPVWSADTVPEATWIEKAVWGMSNLKIYGGKRGKAERLLFGKGPMTIHPNMVSDTTLLRVLNKTKSPMITMGYMYSSSDYLSVDCAMGMES